jgi:hypothetical protein
MLNKISKTALILAVYATQDTNAFLPKIFGRGGNDKIKDDNMVGAKGGKGKDKGKDLDMGGYNSLSDNEQLKSLIISVAH